MTPADEERLNHLSSMSDERALVSEEIEEATRLERTRHDFNKMCMRSAPLNPVSVGFKWNERLTHSAHPEITIHLRSAGTVRLGDETITLMDATKRVAAAAGRGVALADWNGPSGRLGNLAQLEHPARKDRDNEKSPDRSDVTDESASVTIVKPRKAASKPAAAMGDLFD